MSQIDTAYAPERLIQPRMSRGVDWGAKRIVLAQGGGKVLFWRLSHKGWVGRGQSDTVPGALYVLDDADGLGSTGIEIHEGGRLSKTLFMSLEDKINDAFRVEIAHLLHPHKTLLIS